MIYNNNQTENIVKIKVFGVGGGGCNAVNRLISANVQGVTYIAANTDLMALNNASADEKIQLGIKRTRGLGAGSKPQIGKEAAEESAAEIKEKIGDAKLLFLTAGMGGGTGTGATPVIASIAKEMGILTIAIVTKPFAYEGRLKMQYAEAGIEELKKYTDVLLVIPNQKVFDYVKVISENKKEDGAVLKLMQIADDVLHSSIVGITNLIVRHSVINLDFADLCTVIKGKGTAHIGVGHSEGKGKVMNAIAQAANSPLLESNFDGATQIIVSITGDINMSALDIEEAMNLIGQVVSPDCNIIQGIGFDDTMEDRVEVTIVATGFDERVNAEPAIPVQGNETVTPEPVAPVVTEAPTMTNPFGFGGFSAPTMPPVQPYVPPVQQPVVTQPVTTQVTETQPEEPSDGMSSFLRRLRNRGTK